MRKTKPPILPRVPARATSFRALALMSLLLPATSACKSHFLTLSTSGADKSQASSLSPLSPHPVAVSTTPPTPAETATVFLGQQIYNAKCVSCHGPIDFSSKRGRNALQIQAALATQPAMSGIQVTPVQVQALVLALAVQLPVPQPTVSPVPTPGTSPTPGASPSPASSPVPAARANRFTCAPGSPQANTELRRLTKFELTNTLNDLLGSAVTGQLSAQIASLPDETANLGFDNISRTVTADSINAYFGLAKGAGDMLLSNSGFLQSVAGPCALQTPVSADCVQAFITGFGKLTFRRPLSQDEQDLFVSLHNSRSNPGDDGRSGLRMILMAMLQSPQFLYRVETEGTLQPDQVTYQLTGYEIASRLSYLAWSSMPDQALLDAAASGGLNTPQGLAAQRDRVFQSAKAQATLHHFSRQWLSTESMPQFSYSSGFLAGIDASTLRSSMQSEIDDLMDYIVWSRNGNYRDLMTTDVSFAKSQALASVYQVPIYQPGQPLVHIPGGLRNGLLTRAAMVARGVDSGHPLLRGSLIRRKILCDVITLPDPSSVPPGSLIPPTPDPHLSSRDQFTARTSSAQCMTCHQLLNPLGFSLSQFDSLGRFQSQESIFLGGSQIGSQPVNALVDNLTIDPGVSQPASNGSDLGAAIADSGKGEACLVTQWFRYAEGRSENGGQDSCTMHSLMDALSSNGGSIGKMLKATVDQPEFTTRLVGN